MLLLETGVIGVFVSLNLFLFYVFWEAMLIPMYFLIGIWGGQRRVYATTKFVLFTMFGSLLMLVGIFVLYARTGPGAGGPSLGLPGPLPPDPAAQPPDLALPGLRPGLRHQGARSSRSTPGCPTPTSRRRPPARSSWPRSC